LNNIFFIPHSTDIDLFFIQERLGIWIFERILLSVRASPTETSDATAAVRNTRPNDSCEGKLPKMPVPILILD
jgi:hypothetical protein